MVEAKSESNQGKKSGQGIVHATFLLVCLSLYWCVCGIVLWWSYDITPLIRGGYYQRGQALGLVSRMSLIITILTTIAWLLSRPRKTIWPQWRLAWRAAWFTLLVLFFYGAAVFGRMQFASHNLLEDSDFLPVVGHVNSHFFSEVGWITFFVYVTPIMACVSGLLCYLLSCAFEACSRPAGNMNPGV